MTRRGRRSPIRLLMFLLRTVRGPSLRSTRRSVIRGFSMRVFKQVGAGDDPQQLAVLHHRHQALAALHHRLFHLQQGGPGREHLHVGGHVLHHAELAQAVVHRLFHGLAGDDAPDLAVLAHRQHVYVVAGEHLLRLLEGGLGGHGDGRGGHEVLGQDGGVDGRAQHVGQTLARFHQSHVLQGGAGRGGMASAAHGLGDGPRIHLGQARAGHQVDAPLHAGQGEQGVQVFHVHELVHQHRELGHIKVAAHLAHHQGGAAHVEGLGRADQVVQEAHFLGGELAGDQVGDHAEVGPLA